MIDAYFAAAIASPPSFLSSFRLASLPPSLPCLRLWYFRLFTFPIHLLHLRREGRLTSFFFPDLEQVGDFAQLPGYLMAGGNFLGRVISYVVNELVVDGLANKHMRLGWGDLLRPFTIAN
ncbi:hypothetical protein B296_00024590 [Ensete ventricosum]|uniref:Uncharacterized protein n=1 Tax=Ensete ventricosum TaxID=4639 RepID=A0A427A9Y5_ENSVE|nr:hypothetical protein B296_00024590 [Ensete ventricosum]